MSKASKGYEDPWRVGQTKKETPKPKGGMVGTAESAHPMDADLIPHKEFPLRVPGAAGTLLIYGAESVEGAVRIFLALLVEHKTVRETLLDEGFFLEPAAEQERRGFFLTDKVHRLYHPEAQDARDGFNRLLRALRRGVIYIPGFRELIYKVGIIPLLQ